MSKISYNLVSGLPDIYISPLAEKIGSTWVNGNIYDKPFIQKVYSILTQLPESFVAIDVGAQTGCFSLLASYFPNSQWYAFEPIQEASKVLKTNLLLNDIQNVSVYQMAVSDSPSWNTLKIPSISNWGLATLGSNVLRFVSVEERKTECIDLDSFSTAHQIKKIHFIKIDTEGWELSVLRGAKNLIMKDRPIILMECNGINIEQCNVQEKDIEFFLREIDYEWILISDEDFLCLPKKQN